MIRILKLVLLLVVSQVAFAQAPSNYTNINGRYRWIAGMFDSTFHIPKGSTPSLRTGGSTNAGGLFYNTADSSVYTYTGTQWIKVRGSINPQDTTNKYVTQVYKKNGSDSVFYVKGGIHTWAFNDSTGSSGGGGGGKVYYFNGGVSMGTFGGFTMYELGDTANTGTAANFTRATTGNIANFITDPNKPGLLQIPAGVWSVDAWLSETGGGANHAEIWVEVEKWDGSNITTIAISPIEQITEGSTPNLYSWSVTIPTTSLTITDRIIIQFYISNTNGKTVTLYTQNGYVGEVHTTFTTGIGAINGLTAPAQYLVTGTSGTDFNISSSTATHTFNLPTASATNRGALSTTDWTTFNNKVGGSGIANYIPKWSGTGTIDTSQIYQSSGLIGIGTISPNASYKLDINGNVRIGLGFTSTRLTINGNTGTGGGGYINFQKNGSNIGDIGPYSSVVGGSSASDMTFSSNSGFYWSPINTLGMILSSAGNLGIGSALASDSMITVQNGAWIKRGVRLSGLPTGVGTKELRIDANGVVYANDTLSNDISGTGTTNYIPKFTSSSAIGNSVIYESSGSIGISTTTPAVKLEVLGGAETFRLSRATSGSVYMGFAQAGVRKAYIESNNDDLNIFSEAAGSMIFGTNSAERMRLTSTGLGIGTSSPAYKLDVNGTSAFRDEVRINSGKQFRLYNAANNDYTSLENSGSSGTANLVIGTSSGLMTFTSTGNLGLGVTPSAWRSGAAALQVGGYVSVWTQASGAANIGFGVYEASSNTYNYTSTGDAPTLYSQLSGVHRWYTAPSGTAGNAISFTQAMTLDASGNLMVGGTSPAGRFRVFSANTNSTGFNDVADFTNAVDVGLRLQITGTSETDKRASLSTTTSSAFAFGTNSSERMRITSGGNVGIGTTSPSASDWNASSTLLHIYQNSTNGGLLKLESSNASGVLGVGNNIMQIGTITNDDFSFYTNTTERMRITSGGNVGIGTTSPAVKLSTEISESTTTQSQFGGISISNSNATANNGAAISFSFSGSSTNSFPKIGAIYEDRTSSSEDISLFFSTIGAGSYAERMRITSGGNVGIGTSSPNAKLDVNGSINASGELISQSNDARISLYRSTGTNYFDWSSGQALYFSTQTAAGGTGRDTKLVITSGGNVGIGTTSPLQTAANRVVTTINGTSSAILNLGVGGSLASYYYADASGSTLETIGTNTISASGANIINFSTNATERMRITSGGNVGIGTTSVGAKLHINDAASAYTFLYSTINGASPIAFDNSSGNLLVYTASSERMRLTSAGELLINTTSDAGDYKLQVNGRVYGTATDYHHFIVSNGSAQIKLERTSSSAGSGYIGFDDVGFNVRNSSLTEIFNVTSGGAIKTAAPSGGTAKPWKLGEAGVAIGGSDGYAVKVEIDGTLYYLMTGYLPEPEPEAQAGPSSGYKAKFEEPVIKIKSDNQKIKDLEKEIAELKELIKSKIK